MILDQNFIQESNQKSADQHERDFAHLSDKLTKQGTNVDALIAQIQAFEVALPSWALGTGGTRFGRFPIGGEPRNIFEKMDDIALIHQLTTNAPSVSLHIPWDEPDDAQELRDHAAALNLGFDAVNSNTFQDQANQAHSYKFGSLCHTDSATRNQAIEHNIHVIEVGKTLGSKAITIWLADGSNFPGQMHLRKSFERTLDSLKTIYATLPEDWRLFTEHKPYEPAFYASIVQDWGSSYVLSQNLGEKAFCLVDLGHHLPNTNIELVVARLVSVGKLAGFHFNDSKYGDDDLTTGSMKPYQLFLVFNELVDAAYHKAPNFQPSYMIDQSHNLKDPIEALLQSVEALQRHYAKALLVNRPKLEEAQDANDVMLAEMTLQNAYHTEVEALIAESRRRKGGAISLIETYRTSGYRAQKAQERGENAYIPPKSL
jgi:L-rhamnose isomerase/sugar isomerase